MVSKDDRAYKFGEARQELLRAIAIFLYEKEESLEIKGTHIEKQDGAIIFRSNNIKVFLEKCNEKSIILRNRNSSIETFQSYFSVIVNNLIPLFIEHLHEKSINLEEEPKWKLTLKFTAPTDSIEQWTEHFNQYIERVKTNLPQSDICKQIHSKIIRGKTLKSPTALPKNTYITNYIPSPDSKFVGTVRMEELRKIHAYLQSKKALVRESGSYGAVRAGKV